MAKRVFSGIQPTGVPHFGNYAGALRNWVALQNDYDCIYCIVDLHAITVRQSPAELRKKILETAAFTLAAGVDPERSILFVQSDVPEHSELAWILNCATQMGEMRRMTQFKDKTAQGKESTVGLFTYPILMAADILLYQTDAVPVGEDQKQHLELTRDLVTRINGWFDAPAFTMPEPIIPEVGARIMALDDATAKMSKSAQSEYAYIGLDDDAATVRRKFKSAVTDSGREVKFDPEGKPAVSNILEIMHLSNGRSIPELEAHFAGKGYKELKEEAAEVVIECLAPIQERYKAWVSDPGKIHDVLDAGAEKARAIAFKNLRKIKHKFGIERKRKT